MCGVFFFSFSKKGKKPPKRALWKKPQKKMSSIENSKKKGDTFQNPKYLVRYNGDNGERETGADRGRFLRKPKIDALPTAASLFFRFLSFSLRSLEGILKLCKALCSRKVFSKLLKKENTELHHNTTPPVTHYWITIRKRRMATTTNEFSLLVIVIRFYSRNVC